MIIHHDIFQEEGHLIVAEIPVNSDELIKKFDIDDLSYINLSNINIEKRKKEYLGSRLVLKKITKNIDVLNSQEGKPFLRDNSYKISISHSNSFFAVIAHPSKNVGVDIECNGEKIEKIHKKFLSSEEQENIYKEKNTQKLLVAWSAKEALFKIIGKSAFDFARQLKIAPFELHENGEIFVEYIPKKIIYRLKYIQTANYTLVYCITKKEPI